MSVLFAYVRRRYAVLATAAVIAYGVTIGIAGAAIPALYKNCTNLNKKYPHGVGKVGAVDKDAAGHRLADPVTNFKRSDRIYRIAMSYNKGLDRDKDRIACEKK